MIRCIREAGDGVSDSLLAARIFLAEVRFRYRGHSVRLAIVTVIGPQGEMTAHLRKIGHGWKVWYVG